MKSTKPILRTPRVCKLYYLKLPTWFANCLPSLYADHPTAFFNRDRPATDNSHLFVNKA